MDNFRKLSVIVPVVNEVDSFFKTVEVILETCDHSDLEEIIICLADFGSEASKDAVSKIEGSQFRLGVPVRVYVQHGSFEQAMKDTVDMLRGSHYIIQPSDLEEDPQMISQIIGMAKQKPAYVLTGSRFMKGADNSELKTVKRIVYPMFRVLVQLLYSCSLTDTTICYRCVPCDYVKNLVLTEKSYSVLFEMMLKFIRLGYPISEFPIMCNKREEGSSNVKFFREGLRFIKTLFSVRFQKTESFTYKIDNN